MVVVCELAGGGNMAAEESMRSRGKFSEEMMERSAMEMEGVQREVGMGDYVMAANHEL